MGSFFLVEYNKKSNTRASAMNKKESNHGTAMKNDVIWRIEPFISRGCVYSPLFCWHLGERVSIYQWVIENETFCFYFLFFIFCFLFFLRRCPVDISHWAHPRPILLARVDSKRVEISSSIPCVFSFCEFGLNLKKDKKQHEITNITSYLFFTKKYLFWIRIPSFFSWKNKKKIKTHINNKNIKGYLC